MIQFSVFALTFLYSVFLLYCRNGWKKLSSPGRSTSPILKVSVIVAFRNEAKNLHTLLDALIHQDYPRALFEVVFVNDHSTDDSVEVIDSYCRSKNVSNIQVLHSHEHGKKAALKTGIQTAKNDFILVTDADCSFGSSYIKCMAEYFIQKDAYFIAGPVCLSGGNSFLEQLQRMETAGLTGIAGGMIALGNPVLCNGANMGFRKSKFDDVVFSGLYSGDDTDLLNYFSAHFPEHVHFAKATDAIVKTSVSVGFREFWEQRKRWASKIPATMSALTVFIAIIAWFVHFGLLIQLFVVPPNPLTMGLLLTALMIKIISEYRLIASVNTFYGRKERYEMLVVDQIFYCVYIVFVGIMAPFSSYMWKGRSVK